VPVDAGEIPVRIVRPVSAGGDETFPLVVYIHGGGAPFPC
jgi:acetyl esterase/lipase